MITFVPGQIYRRRDIHKQYGGQTQGGISTPSRHPVIFLFSGDQGAQYGYEDKFHEDTFWYTGEGQVGDMQMVRGNAAILNHARKGKVLHLFQYVDTGQVRYVGPARYQGHRSEVGPDRDRNPRSVIVFQLGLDAPEHGTADLRPDTPDRLASQLAQRPLEWLREAALLASRADAPAAIRNATVYSRSTVVRAYVLRRADGLCEGCGDKAPFHNLKGNPYLEAHHVRRRADDGPDHPRAVIALCPNCHARVHKGEDGREYNIALSLKLEVIEPAGDGEFVL